LASSGVGNVFATDIILATLMTCTRSVNSWDIIARRIGNKLFFDKRSVTGVSPIGEVFLFLVVYSFYYFIDFLKF